MSEENKEFDPMKLMFGMMVESSLETGKLLHELVLKYKAKAISQYIPKRKGDRAGWDLVQEKMSECEVNKHILAIIDMAYIKDIELIFITGREGTEALKTVTENELELYFPVYKIFYRPQNDYRKAAVVKKEIYLKHIKGRYDILFAIDDDESNIKMFQELGLNTLQCRYGKNNNE